MVHQTVMKRDRTEVRNGIGLVVVKFEPYEFTEWVQCVNLHDLNLESQIWDEYGMTPEINF